MWDRLVSQRVARVGVIAVADEVDTALDARRRRAEQPWIGGQRPLRVGRCVRRGGARAAEVGVGVVDAGVDDRDLHALAVQPQALPDGRSADERDAADVVRLHELQRPDRHDAGQRSKLFHAVVRDANLDAVVSRLVMGHDGAAEALDAAAQAVLLAPQLALDPVLLAPLELAAGVALLLCNGIPGELHDDRDRRFAYAQRHPYRRDEAGVFGHGLGAYGAQVEASQNAENQRQRRDSAI